MHKIIMRSGDLDPQTMGEGITQIAATEEVDTIVKILDLRSETSMVVFYAMAETTIDLEDHLLLLEVAIEVMMGTVLLVATYMMAVKDGEAGPDLHMASALVEVIAREVQAPEDEKLSPMLSLSYLDENHTMYQMYRSSLPLNWIGILFHGLKASSTLVASNRRFSS
jgi:hypothetical protein